MHATFWGWAASRADLTLFCPIFKNEICVFNWHKSTFDILKWMHGNFADLIPSSPKKPTAYFENISEKEGELASGLYCKKKGRKREKNERELPDSRK